MLIIRRQQMRMKKTSSLLIIPVVCALLAFTVAAYSSQPMKDPVTGMEFVYVKGGCFDMGDLFGDGILEERPLHNVCLNDFYMGKYEVTQAQWKLIVGNTPSHFKKGDNYPVDTVSWDDAQEFIIKLNRRGENKYRLPTEAEWEYAARSKGGRQRWAETNFESELNDYSWNVTNGETQTQLTGVKKGNVLALQDMSGNVWEWVQDRYHKDYYQNSPKDNPEGSDTGYERLLRGGSWYNNSWVMRTSYRLWVGPSYKTDNVGFRLVLPTPKPPVEEAALPEPPEKAPGPLVQALILKDINFDYDKYHIRSYDGEILKNDLAWFKANPGTKVRLEGNCDERGTIEYNLVLGQKRAESARAFLIDLGVDGKLLEVISYGKERPIDPEHNEEAWARNRRVHLVPIE